MRRSKLQQLALCLALSGVVSTLASRSILAQDGDNPLAVPTAETPIPAEPLFVAQPQPTLPTSSTTRTLAPAVQDTPATAATPAPAVPPARGRIQRDLISDDPLDRGSNDPFGRPNVGRPIQDIAGPGDAGTRRIQDQIRQATNALRGAEDDQQKADATKRLTDLLNEYFDSDVQRREGELAQVEERVKNLREQLSRRREKKQEIVDLQLKVAQNEADGLGFFNRPPENDGAFLNLFGGQPNPPARHFDVYSADQPNRRPGDPQLVQPPPAGGGARNGGGGRDRNDSAIPRGNDERRGRGGAGSRRGDASNPFQMPPQLMPAGPPPRGGF